MRDDRPVRVCPFDILGHVRAPSLQRVTGMGQIKLAVDNGPSLGIDRVFVRTKDRPAGHTPSAIAIVLSRITVRISDEQVAMGGAGKAPASVMPPILNVAWARHRLTVGEIGD